MFTSPVDSADPLLPYYYKHVPEIIGGIEVPPITDDWVENYPSAN